MMLVHGDTKQAGLRLRVMEPFVQKELLDGDGQPRGARALGVVACSDAYHDLHPFA